MKLLKKKNSEKGFTLIEMVIVIAIMGVLITMLLPNLLGFWESSKQTSCESSEKMLAGAVTGYLVTNPNSTFFSNTTTDVEINAAVQTELIDKKFLVEAIDAESCGTAKKFYYKDGKVVAK
jgi:type IV pilus assembly protein PilA